MDSRGRGPGSSSEAITTGNQFAPESRWSGDAPGFFHRPLSCEVTASGVARKSSPLLLGLPAYVIYPRLRNCCLDIANVSKPVRELRDRSTPQAKVDRAGVFIGDLDRWSSGIGMSPSNCASCSCASWPTLLFFLALRLAF